MTVERALEAFPRKHYERPPVVEAVGRLHWAEAATWNLATPGLLYERIRDLYPEDPRSQATMEAKFGPNEQQGSPGVGLQVVQSGQPKVVFGADNGTRLLIVGSDEISVHGLPPHEGWESLELRLFLATERLAGLIPTAVSQLSVRYVNRVEIGESEFAMEDYFTVGFVLPDGFPKNITGFLDRSESGYDDGHSKIAFTWGTTESAPGTSSFVVDLDLVSDLPDGGTVEEARRALNLLKDRETAAFESLLQPKLREVFGVVNSG